MSDENMKEEDVATILRRLDDLERKMVTKTDVFQSVLTVQGFTFAIMVGVIVVLNAVVGFA